MATNKTVQTDASAEDFINDVTDETRRKDGFILLRLFSEITGEKAKMWGSSIIGFGQYHYKYESSRQEGDWPLTGFSPRKQSLTVYVMLGFDNYQNLLAKLGKHKTSVSCLYINKLADVDMKVLRELITLSYAEMKRTHNQSDQ